MQTIIKIIFIFIVLIVPSFCLAQEKIDFQKSNISLDEKLKNLTEADANKTLDINKEIETLEEIEKIIEKSLSKTPHSPAAEIPKKIQDDDYESFLNDLKTKPTPKKKKQQNLTQQLQSDKINVVVEINKYFIDDKLCPVDLQDCLAIALENNFNIKILGARQEQGKWFYRNAYSAFLPNGEINFHISRLHGDYLAGGVIPIFANESPIWSLMKFSWRLFDGGSRFFDLKSRRNSYYSDIKNLDFQKQQTLKNTAVSYYTLLGIKLGIEILTRNLKETQAQLKLTTQNFEAGIGTRFDVLRAKAEVAQAEQRLINSYNNFRLEQANLANILGISVFTTLLPVEEDVDIRKLMDKELSMQDISKISMKARPDLNSIRFSIKALLNDKKRIYSGFIPKIDSFWSMGYVGTTRDGMGPSNFFGIETSIPFGTNLGTNEYTNIKRINAKLKESRLQLKDAVRNIQEDIIESFYNTKAAEERIKAAKEEVVAADESLRLAFLRLEAGLGIYVDVLQSQTAKTDAKINLIRAIIDHNVAQINLLFDSGTISTENILKDYDKYLSKKYIPPTPKSQKEEITLPNETPEIKLPERIQGK